MIHEVGHGLGLAHPHDRGGTSTVFPGVTRDFGDYGQFDLNQGIYTMMSYNDGWPTAPHRISPSDDYGYEGTPMAVDIAVLQDKYGANGSYHRGDDNYTLPTANASGTFYSCLWDAGGIDTIRAGATERNAVIDLHDATLRAENGGGGFVSYARGIHGGFTIANGVVIENAVGGRGDDRLTGNEAGNVLEGGDGDDRLTGGLGRDVLTGAADRDTFVFEAVRDSRAGSGIDRITDFDRADEIDLTDIDWSGERGDQAFTFVDGRLSEAGEVRIRQAGGDTFLEAGRRSRDPPRRARRGARGRPPALRPTRVGLTRSPSHRSRGEGERVTARRCRRRSSCSGSRRRAPGRRRRASP